MYMLHMNMWYVYINEVGICTYINEVYVNEVYLYVVYVYVVFVEKRLNSLLGFVHIGRPFVHGFRKARVWIHGGGQAAVVERPQF
jgi:hypothetical protein